MTHKIPHVHDESTDESNERAHSRFNGVVQTRNFRLSRTTGTATKFTLMDRRTGCAIEFDYAEVGQSLGRGSTAQLYVGEPDLEMSHNKTGDCTLVGEFYQHDLDDHLLECLEYIEETSMLPPPDTVLEPEQAVESDQSTEDGDDD